MNEKTWALIDTCIVIFLSFCYIRVSVSLLNAARGTLQIKKLNVKRNTSASVGLNKPVDVASARADRWMAREEFVSAVNRLSLPLSSARWVLCFHLSCGGGTYYSDMYLLRLIGPVYLFYNSPTFQTPNWNPTRFRLNLRIRNLNQYCEDTSSFKLLNPLITL